MIFRAIESETYPLLPRNWFKQVEIPLPAQAVNNSFAARYLQRYATFLLQAPDNITEKSPLATQKPERALIVMTEHFPG
jgi:hypothetical protein